MCGITVYTGRDKKEKLKVSGEFNRIKYRGPDNSSSVDLGENGWMGFHRLSIIDVSDRGNQPFNFGSLHLVVNGEVYNYKALKEEYSANYQFMSDSDCEVIIPMFLEHGMLETARKLDAEFVCVIYDGESGKYYAARDPVGIRPLFYGYTINSEIMFASEMKALHSVCKEIKPFPPGYIYDGSEFVCYNRISSGIMPVSNDLDDIFSSIRDLLVKAVEKRLQSDVPVGFLCSGGLDSSLVCTIAAGMSDKPIRTFATGINIDPIDTKYARIVADHLGTDHTEVLFTRQDIFDNLSTLIYNLETWDITTIRASVGMYLLCRYISEKTDIKVILTGEISDELFGYKYTDFAPSPREFQNEAVKRIDENIYV
jgi:asparagine synthase (glutamine-hydrolysing)